MRMNLLIRFTMGVAAVTAFANGCSSAPPAETGDHAEDALAIGGGGTLGGGATIDYCSMLPALRTAPNRPHVQGLDDPTPRDCYQHVQGYEVAVGARVTSCPSLALPGVGAWYAWNAAPEPNWTNATVPAFSGTAGMRVCHYPFATLYSGWSTPYKAGNDKATEEWLAGNICTALTSAGVSYTAVRYELPSYVSDVPASATSIDVSIGPNGFPVPDLTNQFASQYCDQPGIHGPCGSCMQ